MKLFLAASLCFSTLGALAAPEVKLRDTKVIGSSDSGVDFYLGLPFAKPPVGNLRLRPPVLTTSLEGKTFNATKYGASCPQTASREAVLALPLDNISEDCLSINVFRPENVPVNRKLPVMVWIYGGGFTSGSSTLFHGVELVSRSVQRETPIVYVSFNYRLGPLGFPTGKEAVSKKVLNLGLQDQIVALEWVRKNIHFFGGDKAKVTVFGESAGGSSIGLFLTQSKIDGLARAAILQSPASLPIFDPQEPSAEARWSRFLEFVPSCASTANGTASGGLDCLRNADTASILQAVKASPIIFQPTLDGPSGFLPSRPSKTGFKFKSRLPLIIGTTVDEGTALIPQTVSDVASLREAVFSYLMPPLDQAMFDEQANAILELYPDIPALGSPFGTGNETFGLSSQYKRAAAIFADLFMESWRKTISVDFARRGINVWGFQFADANAEPLSNGAFAPGSLGVPHGSELPYVFGSLSPPASGVESAQKLSEIMRDYWISFANTLDPNDGHGNQRPSWPKYDASNPSTLRLNGTSSEVIQDDFRVEKIAFFQAHPDFSRR